MSRYVHNLVRAQSGACQRLTSLAGPCGRERVRVETIVGTPGHKLSLQTHHDRAAHWIVVAGTAQVTCEDKVFTLSEDQSTYIPLGHKHRLENKGKIRSNEIHISFEFV